MRYILRGIQNLCILVCSIIITYLFLEFVLFRAFLPHLPLRFYGYLPKEFCIFAQSSKKGLIPQNYIAIAGDSYAQGTGDWFLTTNDWGNSNFASHGILNKKMNRDVITFGIAGAGSLEGILAGPINNFKYLNRSLFYKIKAPKIILVYFYENDINNNFSAIEKKFKHAHDNMIRDRVYLKRFIGKTIIGRKAKTFRWNDNLVFLNFIRNMLHSKKNKGKIIYDNMMWEKGEINRVSVNGKETAIPDGLQSPALELTEEEIDISVYVFEQAINYLSDFFPTSKLIVVYIPSPLSSYDLSSEQVSIQTYHGRSSVYNSQDVIKNSDLICFKVKQVTEKKGFLFIDTRKLIKDAARRALIHGPLDWKHFNKVGYTVLSLAVLAHSEDN